TAQPHRQTHHVGSNATYTVAASGTAPLSYQWRFNGTNISGASTNSYTRSASQTNDAGGYSVLVTNLGGRITSAVAMLTATSSIPPSISQQPVSRAAVPGGFAQFDVSATGQNLAYQWQMNQSNIVGATSTSL